MSEANPSLYELLLQNFQGELDLHAVDEADQPVLSVLDNVQRILNTRAGSLAHLPDYGLPDMGLILQGLPGSAHALVASLQVTLLIYEPRLAALAIDVLPQQRPGHLEYALRVQLKDGQRATLGALLGPDGKALLRHLKRPDAGVRLIAGGAV